jgi:hypothetical protein
VRVRPAVIAAVLAVTLGVVIAAAIPWDGGIKISTAEVPSFWDHVTLKCKVTTFSEQRSRLEVFGCRTDDSLKPPPGHYTEATTTWYSDVDRRRALRHDIVITRSGSVSGWALY